MPEMITILNIQMEIFTIDDEKFIWLGTENGSGATYKFSNKEELIDRINFYLRNYCIPFNTFNT